MLAGMPNTPAVRPQTLIAVQDVRRSSSWYSHLLHADHLEDHEHRNFYDRIYVQGTLIMQLHAWDAEDHPNLTDANAAKPGHGVLLWFEIDDFDAAVDRARALKAEVVLEPHINEAPAHREIWLRDLDGYVVVLASPDGEATVSRSP